MAVARAFFRTRFPLSPLAPSILGSPPEPYTVSVLVDARTEAEVRDRVRANHPDVTEVEVRWALDEDLPRGNLPAPDGVCPSCGSAYRGLALHKLREGGYRWEGAWVDTRACVCEAPDELVFGVHTALPLDGWWVRVRFRTTVDLARITKRHGTGVIVQTRDGQVLRLKPSGAPQGKRRFPHIPPEDLARVPLRIPVR